MIAALDDALQFETQTNGEDEYENAGCRFNPFNPRRIDSTRPIHRRQTILLTQIRLQFGNQFGVAGLGGVARTPVTIHQIGLCEAPVLCPQLTANVSRRARIRPQSTGIFITIDAVSFHTGNMPIKSAVVVTGTIIFGCGGVALAVFDVHGNNNN